VTTYGMSKIARGRCWSCSLAGAAPCYWNRIRSTQSETIVMIISYIEYYTWYDNNFRPRYRIYTWSTLLHRILYI